MLKLAISTDDSKIHIYQLNTDFASLKCFPKLLKTIPLKSLQATGSIDNNESKLKLQAKMPIIVNSSSWRQDNLKVSCQTGEYDNDGDDVEISLAATRLEYFNDKLIVCANSHLLILNSNSNEVIFVLDIIREIGSISGCMSLYYQQGMLDVIYGNPLSGELQWVHAWETKGLKKIQTKAKLNIEKEDDVLSTVVRHSIQQRTQGPWSDNLYRDCMTQLQRFGITDSSPNINSSDRSQLADCIPDYVLDALYNDSKTGESNILSLKLNSIPVKGSLLYAPSAIKSDKPSSTKVTSQSSKESYKTSSSKSNSSIKKGSLNQPLTFRSTVSSSGYLQGPRSTQLFKLPGKTKQPNQSSVKSMPSILSSAWESFHLDTDNIAEIPERLFAHSCSVTR